MADRHCLVDSWQARMDDDLTLLKAQQWYEEEQRTQAMCQREQARLALPEAPASVNVRLMIGGRECQVTLRDVDETRLLDRLAVLLARFPLPQTPTPTGASPSLSAARPTPDGWCAPHGVQMPLHHGKDGRTWYSHQTAEGWCKGR